MPVNEMVKTQLGDVPERAAVPAGLAAAKGAVNARAADALESAMPAPLSEMMILPVLGTVVTGVSVTLMVTAVAPLATLLSVIAGLADPTESTIAGYSPVTLAPTMVVPSAAIVAAATAVFAGCAAAGLVNPGMVNVIGAPASYVPVLNEMAKR